MENILKLIQDLALSHSWAFWLLVVFSVLGSLVVLASSVVLMTPTKKDDEIEGAIRKNKIGGMLLSFFEAFSLVKKK